MKTCISCNETKSPLKFAKHGGFSDGRRSTCKDCYNIWQKSDVARFVRKMFATQLAASTKRGHPAPNYDAEALHAWVVRQEAFPSLWAAYQAAGQLKDLAPSADRKDSNAPYSLHNLELVTWGVNNSRGSRDIKKGTKITQHRKVSASNLDGSHYKTYVSLHEAARDVGGVPTNIQRVADGTVIRKPDGRTSVLRQTKGFMWKWAE